MASVDRPFARRWCLALLLGLTGCLNSADKEPRAAQSLRMTDLFSVNPNLANSANPPKIDPQATRLTVTPMESTSPVNGQCVLVATVVDADGQPRHNRRIEWRLTGVGRIVEVDEGLNGRGRRVDDRLAFGQTVLVGQTVRRTNGEELGLQAGQSWCAITSDAEGDSVVTVSAPEVADAGARRVVLTKHWTEADWRLPSPAFCPVGSRPVLVTQVLHSADRRPLAGYRVRYRVTDGAPAVFVPGEAAAEAVSDARGEARVTVMQPAAAAGRTLIAVEVYRPSAAPAGGQGALLGRGQTSIDWQPPQFGVSIAAPEGAAIGQDLPVTVTVANTGRVASPPLTLTLPLPEGIVLEMSEPATRPEAGRLQWRHGGLGAGESQAVRAVLRAPRAGTVPVTAFAETSDGVRADAQARVRIGSPGLRVRAALPRAVGVGEAVTAEFEVANPGDAPATDVVMRAEIDAGLEHASLLGQLEIKLGTVGPRQARTVPLPLVARQSGRPVCRAAVRADGGLTAQTEQSVVVAERQMSLTINGPESRFLDRPVSWDVRIANPGELALGPLTVRVAVPPEVRVLGAAGGQRIGSEIVWRLETLPPREERTFQLSGTAAQLARGAKLVAIATADGLGEQRAEATLEVVGTPVVRAEIAGPAGTIEAGKPCLFTIRVRNQGTLAAQGTAVCIAGSGLTLRHATGPTVGRLDGGRYVFALAPRLDVRQVLVYRVEALPEKPGDARLRVEVQSESSPTPVVVEEAIRIVPAQAPPAATPAASGG